MLARRAALCAGICSVVSAQSCPPSRPAPRGYNSWDADSNWVNETSILAAAEWVRDNLLSFGFDTITIDGGWYDNSSSPGSYSVDAYGLPIPDPVRFPSSAGGRGLLPLAQRVNAMGLKLGAWTIRGISTVAYEANLPIKNSPFHARDVGVLGRETNCSWDASVVGTNAPSAAASAWYASLAQHYLDNGLAQIKIDCMFNETWCVCWEGGADGLILSGAARTPPEGGTRTRSPRSRRPSRPSPRASRSAGPPAATGGSRLRRGSSSPRTPPPGAACTA